MAATLFLVLAMGLLSDSATPAPIVLTGGAATSTFGSQAVDYVSVSGTSSIDGTPSTYTAAGSGTLTIGTDGGGSSVSLSDFGVMIANIAVDASGTLDVATKGSFTANRSATFASVAIASGGSVQIGSIGSLNTLASGTISLSGAGSLTRSAGGHYSTGGLSLSGDASADFVAGDAIAGNILVSDNASFTGSAPLTTPGYASATTGATFTATAATTFGGGFFAYDGGKLVIGSTGSVTTAPGSLFYLSGADAFTRSSGGTYSAGSLVADAGAAVTFTADDSILDDLSVDSGAVVTLSAPLVITQSLNVYNGGSIVRGSPTDTISATALTVYGTSSFQSIAGDSFTTASISAGGQFSNAAPLTLSSLTVSGDDGAGQVSTATLGATVTIADGGNVQVSNGGRLDVAAPLAVAPGGTASLDVSGLASDSTASVMNVTSTASGFGSISVGSGATLDLDGGSIAADTLAMGGVSAFTRTGGSYTVGTLHLADSAAAGYLVGDSITTSVVLQSAATLDLGKNLVLSEGLSLSDGAAITRTTATISASALSISGLSSLALGTGDAIGSLSLSGGAQASSSTALVLEGSATPLSIVDDGSVLTLSSFDGLVTTPSSDVHYAMRLYGDQQSLLESYITAGRIVLGSAPQTPGVVYNPARYGNSTFIAYVVPEPSTMIFVIGSLTTLPFFRRRRG